MKQSEIESSNVPCSVGGKSNEEVTRTTYKTTQLWHYLKKRRVDVEHDPDVDEEKKEENCATMLPIEKGIGQGGEEQEEREAGIVLKEVPRWCQGTTDNISETDKSRALKVLFLSSDTGGGHRASAESLAQQFELLFPGSTYHLLDVITQDGFFPYRHLVPAYKHLSAHPNQWKVVFEVSNTRTYELLSDFQMKVLCERAIRRRIKSYDPDVVVSVHPLMTTVPALACKNISQETGKHLPMFTVVTDLGAAHCTWFGGAANYNDGVVEKLFIASKQIRNLAKGRGRVGNEKLCQLGLPIRNAFTMQAKALGDRTVEEGKTYQLATRHKLKLNEDPSVKVVLVMGGGEGVGALSTIVDALYFQFRTAGIDCVVVVVCGRNERLQQKLRERNWDELMQVSRYFGNREKTKFLSLERRKTTNRCDSPCESSIGLSPCDEAFETLEKTKCWNGAVTSTLIRLLSRSNSMIDLETNARQGNVEVIGLGFVNNMADYMVAADVLVTKAGPGTIAEAASLGLPVMLTSFLPGQEEGNIDFVVDGNFGDFCSDPYGIAGIVCSWLTDPDKLAELSRNAKIVGKPNAARDIALAIGESSLRWKEINSHNMDNSG